MTVAKKFLSVIVVVTVLLCGTASSFAETETWTSSDGKAFVLGHTLKNSYNTKGQLAKQEHYNKSGSLVNVYKIKCDAKGNTVLKRTYRGDKITGTEKFKYDDKGNVIEIKDYNADGVLQKDRSFTYKHTLDKNGRPLSTKIYSEGNLRNIVDNKYNEKGDKIESKTFDGKDMLSAKTYAYKYNSDGNKTQELLYLHNKLYTCTLYTYNSNGQCTKEVFYYDSTFFDY